MTLLEPYIAKAKAAGLHITLHIAEVISSLVFIILPSNIH